MLIKIFKTLFVIVSVVALIMVGLWLAGFHLETFDYFVGKATVLFYRGDVLWYWEH